MVEEQLSLLYSAVFAKYFTGNFISVGDIGFHVFEIRMTPIYSLLNIWVQSIIPGAVQKQMKIGAPILVPSVPKVH